MLEIRDRDHARQLLADHGISSEKITRDQARALRNCINKRMISSEYFHGSFRMNKFTSQKYLTCRTDRWDGREAVSFNDDGFIGFAGWADKKNIRPILDGVADWLETQQTRQAG